MTRSQIAQAVARRFPLPFRVLLTLSLKGYLPLSIYDHWVSQTIAAGLWPAGRSWVGRVARLPNGMRIEVDPRDALGRTILRGGHWEPETISFLQSYLRSGMTFLDVGANIGLYSVIASRLVGRSGTVYSFEPHPLLYRVLRSNAKRNDCRNIVVNNYAIADRDGERLLFLSSEDSFANTSLRPPARFYSGSSVPVRTVSLDSYVSSMALSQIDVIKLDIEGAELQALSGASTVLKEYAELVILVEFCDENTRQFGYSTADLASFLRSKGFKLFRLQVDGLVPYRPIANGPRYFNVIATRADAPYAQVFREARPVNTC